MDENRMNIILGGAVMAAAQLLIIAAISKLQMAAFLRNARMAFGAVFGRIVNIGGVRQPGYEGLRLRPFLFGVEHRGFFAELGLPGIRIAPGGQKHKDYG